MANVILRLPPEERLVLLLRDRLGLSYQELSECMSCSEEQLTELLRRGRDHLQQECKTMQL